MTRIENLKSKVENLIPFVLLIALVLLFFWRIITPRLQDRAIFPPGDFSDQFWMFRQFEARAFAAGRLPLWSENFNSGHPFLADVQSAIFYPVGLIWTLLVVAMRGANFTLLDLEIEAIAHFILAGVFTFLFARRLLGSRVAALISATTFTFGGYLTSYPPQQLAILETATWLPLALLLLERGLTRMNAGRTGMRDFIAAGVTLGIAILAGHPQTFLFVLYACTIYFIWRVIQLRIANCEASLWDYVLRFTFSLLIATGISAAQWIPTLEYQTVSTRAGLSWSEAAAGFPTLDPLQMILPGFVSAFQSPLYIGVLPLWLALFALFYNRSREKIFWAGLALGSLVVSFGFYAFAYAVMYLFAPGFALFRGQERLALVISFALAILAGYGARDLTQTSIDSKHLRRAWALLPAGVTISVLMLLTLYISGTLRQSGRIAFLADRAGLMTLLFVLASALVAWRFSPSPLQGAGRGEGEKTDPHLHPRPFRARRLTFAPLAIALVVFDLFSINNAAYNAQPNERFPVTSIIQTIQADRGVFRVADEARMPGHFGIAYNLQEIGGISPLRISRYDMLLDLPAEKIWSLLNVRYAITTRPGFGNADDVAQDGETHLLRLNDWMPRAWFVPYAIENPNDQAVLEAVSSDAFDPWSIAYVAKSPATPLPSPPIRREQNRSAHASDFQPITPEHSRVLVNAPADGLVVLSENHYYPGWTATVDGVPAPILRTNVAMSGVPVRAGAKQIEFVFDPWSVKIGIMITAITGILVMLAVMQALGVHGTNG